ncbi:uncharacterized protein [Clinocottus analis]|uniref:uncharacterized protein n=1 Tax=Clinocottus analis TaxID=304258 RepID=UPI0035BED576
MACGVHLGILLICLVQAEHVHCLWASQARRQDGNTNVGFSQQGSGFGGSNLQNRLRQASGSPGSAQSSRLITDFVGSGYSRRLPSSGPTQTLSPAAKSGYASVGFVQSRSESKPNWRTTKSKPENQQKMPKKFSLSASIAGGSSLSKYNPTPISKKRTWPVQQGAPSTSNYRSSGSESLQSPREIYSKPASGQSAARKASVNSETPAYTGLQGSSNPMKSSSPSSKGAAATRRIPVRTKTSASGAARRVSTRRPSAASKRSQTESWKPYSSNLVPVNALNVPASRTSSVGSSGQGFAPSGTHQIPQRFGGAAIRRLRKPADKKEVSVRKSQQPSSYVAPQRQSSLQQPSSYVAPQRQSSLQQPSSYVAPQRQSSLQQPSSYVAPQRQSSLQQPSSYVAPQRQSSLQQPSSYVAPQRPSSLQQPSSYVAPQRPSSLQQPSSYVAPQRPSSLQQLQSVHPEAKWKSVRERLGQNVVSDK